jgi:hypothetical protein
MSYQPDQSETARRERDSGSVNRAWRWFSEATIRMAESYRDLSWRVVIGHVVMASVLVILSRLNPALPTAPWMLIIGVFWLVYGVRMGVLKAVGQATRQTET